MVAAFGEQELIELTNLRNPTADEIDSDILEANIAQGDSIIDSYLAVRYTLPLSSTPAVLTGYANQIVRYLLDQVSARPDVRQRYEDAIAWLKLVARGDVSLGIPTDDLDDETLVGGASSDYYNEDGIFTSEALSGY